QLASETFQRRIDGFLAAPGKRRRIVIEVGSHRYRLKRRTRRDGTFFGTLTLPSDVLAGQIDQAARIEMRLLRAGTNHPVHVESTGDIFYAPPTGLSVISDIDDTIKFTEATNRKALLINTFLNPFVAVDGMAEVYRQWQHAGCSFHYVSSSPWQLYQPLAQLCMDHGFPAGSMHLRYFRVRDEMFKRFRPLRHNSKVAIMVHLLKRLPERKFVLVGDSGERDPEIYWFLARRFPQNVVAIAIRNVPGHPLEDKRLRKLRELGSGLTLRVFDAPAELADLVPALMHRVQAT
ncbi:MAG: DUF2183 domain-containing protein, partial [Planctomycetota bacterium]